jgi:hypothetical protein
MKLFLLPRFAATLGCAALLLLATTTARAQSAPLPGADVILEPAAGGEAVTTGRTDGTGVAVLKVAKPGNYTVVVRPLSVSRSGNYSRTRVNTTAVSVTGASKPMSGSYNITGNQPCRVEISLARTSVLTVRITPPPQPVRNDEIKPAMN